jgi:hypothetical protein
VELVQVRFTLRLRDQWSMWMQDGCKIYTDSYMASNGSGFMVTQTISKNHLLEVGLPQNWETTVLRTLTTVDLFYFITCEDPPASIEIHWKSIWSRTQSHMTSHYAWGRVTTLHDCGGVLGRRPLDTFLLGSHHFMVTNVQDWSPNMSFILKGSQISALQLKGWFKSKTSISKYRNEIQSSY